MTEPVSATASYRPLHEELVLMGTRLSSPELCERPELPRFEDYPLPFLTSVTDYTAESEGFTSGCSLSERRNGIFLSIPISNKDEQAVTNFRRSVITTQLPFVLADQLESDSLLLELDLQALRTQVLHQIQQLGDDYGRVNIGNGNPLLERNLTSEPNFRRQQEMSRIYAFCGFVVLSEVDAGKENIDYVRVQRTERIASPPEVPCVLQNIHNPVLMLGLFPHVITAVYDTRDPGLLSDYVIKLEELSSSSGVLVDLSLASAIGQAVRNAWHLLDNEAHSRVPDPPVTHNIEVL